MAYFAVGCEFLLAFVFVTSTISKVRTAEASAEFRSAIRALDVVPRRWSVPLAVGVVIVEASVPVLFALPLRAFGAAVALVLLTGFTAIIVVSMIRGVRVACRCFGASTAAMGWRHVCRNLALSAAALTSLAHELILPPVQVSIAGVVTAAGGAGVAALLLVHFDDLVDLFSHAGRA